MSINRDGYHNILTITITNYPKMVICINRVLRLLYLRFGFITVEERTAPGLDGDVGMGAHMMQGLGAINAHVLPDTLAIRSQGHQFSHCLIELISDCSS